MFVIVFVGMKLLPGWQPVTRFYGIKRMEILLGKRSLVLSPASFCPSPSLCLSDHSFLLPHTRTLLDMYIGERGARVHDAKCTSVGSVI